MIFVCANCGERYEAGPDIWRCTKCGGSLDVADRPVFDRANIRLADRSLWRYRAMIPTVPGAPIVSLGEGMTPLVAADFAGKHIHFKLEYIAPTGSFKDRGTTVLVTNLKAWGVTRAADDSSGNAGASFAAYCGRAGIVAEIFTPAYASPAKLSQIEIFGAHLNKIEGVREKATEAVEAATQSGMVYGTHAWSPFTLEGTKTIAYELWEQLRGDGWPGVPDVYISPIGQGSLFLGAYRGFKDLLAVKSISKLPRMIGVQSAGCPPIVEALQRGLDRAAPIQKQQSVAEGIALSHPIRDAEILRAIRETGGDAIAVSDEETLAARRALAQIGLYVEPTSAVVGAALQKLALDGIVVAALTGSGLKSPA